MSTSSATPLRLLLLGGALLGLGSGLYAQFGGVSPKIWQGPAPDATAAFAGRPAPSVAGAWDAYERSLARPAFVQWGASGTPENLYGTLSAPYGADDEAAARAFLAQHTALFRMETGGRDLAFVRRVESPVGAHVVFQQTVQGVPVHGAQVAVHFNRSGAVIGVNNGYVPGLRVDVTRRSPRAGMGELVVYGRALALRSVAETDGGPTWERFVDAQTGALLARRDVNRYVNGVGRVYGSGGIARGNAVVATQNNALRDQNDSATAVPSAGYVTVTLQGLAGNGLLDGTYASSSKTKKRASNASNTFSYDRSSVGFSETMGYFWIDAAERYIQSLGFTNINNRQQVFSANGTTQDNSFYSPSTKQITYGTGGVDDAEDAEVILHEYGHSIQDNQVPGFGSTSEGGAMGEGFGDYWAASVCAQTSGGFQDIYVMEWDATAYSATNPPYLRRLDSAKHYPESVVREVHADGEIWSAALWQIRGALGASRADTLILQAHFLMAAGTNFNAGANAIVTAAINLGYTSTEVASVRTILSNRGFTVTV